MKNTSTSSLPLSQRLVNEYGSYVGQTNWTFYCTLSTKYPLTLNSARRSIIRLHEFIKIIQKIENEIFWIAEPFDSKYGFHIHCLVKFKCIDPHKRKKELIKAWQTVTKGSYGKKYNWTSIVSYDANLGAKYYVVKGIGKNDVEYGFL